MVFSRCLAERFSNTFNKSKKKKEIRKNYQHRHACWTLVIFFVINIRTSIIKQYKRIIFEKYVKTKKKKLKIIYCILYITFSLSLSLPL